MKYLAINAISVSLIQTTGDLIKKNVFAKWHSWYILHRGKYI